MTHHYYGDLVRKLFMAAAVVMLVSLPVFSKEIDTSLVLSLMGILLVSLAAGYMSPVSKTSAWFNVLIAAGGLFVFELAAVQAYVPTNGVTSFFLVNQALAVLFLFSLYFGVKTARGIRLSRGQSLEE